MQVIISSRNVEIAEGLRSRIDDRFQRLTRFDPRASRVEVTLAEEKNRSIAEALMSVDGGGPVFAKSEATDARTAVDRLYDKMSRQLRRARKRRIDRKAPPHEAEAWDGGGPGA
ncbi:MAG: ribosome-associated translation inhibitor RaiA [Gemmatimonadota bacterium]|nr:ribosome-associated translation inhibitor RaiA [Gemmatimonadota bacterium]